jgi:hypothetical protein
MNSIKHASSILVGISAATVLAAVSMPQARADIIKIQNPGSTCSDGTCNGGTPFSLTAIENGTQSLTIGGSVGSAATYIVKDDIAGSITSISLDLTGTVASNQFLNIQFGGGFSGTGTLSPNDVNCTTCGGNNGHADFFDPLPGGNGSTQVAFNTKFTWSGINPSISNGTVFEFHWQHRRCSRPHRWCWTSRSDLGERRPSRLVATAAEDRLNI